MEKQEILMTPGLKNFLWKTRGF